MPEGPTIGIVIPVYDTNGDYLDQCVASALDQTVSAPIVVVDDGSTARDTLDSLQKWEARGVRVLRHDQNRGASAALNTGTADHGTALIAPLGSDDLLHREFCERVSAVFADDDAMGIVSVDLHHFGAQELVTDAAEVDDIAELLFSNRIAGASVFRKSDWQALGGFATELVFGEDWDFWLRILRTGRKAFTLHEVLYEYRRHDQQSIELTTGQVRLDQHLEVVRRNREIWEEHVVEIMSTHWALADEYEQTRARLTSFERRYGALNRILAAVTPRRLRTRPKR